MELIEYEIAKNCGKLQGQIDCLSKSLTSLEIFVERLKIENHILRKRLKSFEETLDKLQSKTDWEEVED